MSFLFACKNFCIDESRESELNFPIQKKFKTSITKETDIQIPSVVKKVSQKNIEIKFDIRPLTINSHKNDILPSSNTERIKNKSIDLTKKGMEISTKNDFTNLVSEHIYSQTLESVNYGSATTSKTKDITNSSQTQQNNMPLIFKSPHQEQPKFGNNLCVENASKLNIDKPEVFDSASCTHCEEIYKFSIINDIPLKLMVCSFCNNSLNTNSLDFYIAKYKDEVFKSKAEKLSREVNSDRLSKLGDHTEFEKGNYSFKYDDDSEVQASSEIIYNDVSQPQIEVVITEIEDKSDANIEHNSCNFSASQDFSQKKIIKEKTLDFNDLVRKQNMNKKQKSNTSGNGFNNKFKKSVASFNTSGAEFSSQKMSVTGSLNGSQVKKDATTANINAATSLKTKISLLKPVERSSTMLNAKVS